MFTVPFGNVAGAIVATGATVMLSAWVALNLVVLSVT